MSQFRLFPPLTPTSKEKLPSRGGRGRKVRVDNQSSPSTSTLLEDLKSSHKTDAVLRQIRENAKAIQPPKPPPKAHVTKSTSKLPDRLRNADWDRRNDKDKKPERLALSSSSTLVEHQPPGRFSTLSIPIESIFPRYNPNLILSQQEYYPRFSGNRSQSSHKSKGLVLSPEPEIDRALGPKTVPASVMDFPAGLLDSVEIQYSSAAELQGLWEAANGQRPKNHAASFNLRLTRTDPTTFTFGDPSQPFYTLRTTTPSELTISRTNPSKPTSSIPILTLTLEDRHHRESPNAGPVSVIFSRLAAMLAIEQAEELSRQQHLTPSEARESEIKALNRAQEQESCNLTWNHDLRLYELDHPSLSKQTTPAPVGAAGIPLSPVRPKHPAVHITVSTSSSNERNPQPLPPTILATTPTPSNSTSTRTARTSTFPFTDTDDPLASLDLSTKTLRICASTIIATIPSLYAIDSLVAGILAVAAAEEGTRGVLMGMKIGCGGRQNAMPEVATTFVKREDGLVSRVRSNQNTGTINNDNDNEPSSRPKFGFLGWFTNPKPKKEKKRQIVVEEFDLEKYGRYGRGSSREGEKLPSVARGVLRVLFWGLELAVKMLTAVVKVFAWVLVNLTRCVTSERF